jgi:hypothetical protein
MESNGRAVATREPGAIIEQVVMKGDLAALKPEERVAYYRQVCESLGLNPLTKPFEYIELDRKLTLYARRDATDQLRSIHKVSVTIVSRERLEDVYIVTARATTADGRSDEATGVVAIAKEDGDWRDSQSGKRYFQGNGKFIPLHGDALANALMKAETKAKRRATLSIVGLGWLDESELETIPTARVVEPAAEAAPAAHQPPLKAAPSQPSQPTPQPQQPAAPQAQSLPCPRGKHCVGSGRIEQTRVEATGKVYDLTPDDIARATEKQFGIRLCYACGQAEKARREAAGKAEPAPVYAGPDYQAPPPAPESEQSELPEIPRDPELGW